MSTTGLEPHTVTVAGSSPYPWPYDGDLHPHRLALVIAGAQRWWAERTDEGAAMAATADAIAARLRRMGVLIVFVRHLQPESHTNVPPHLPSPSSADAELVIVPREEDLVVDAWGFDGFFASRLEAELRSARRDQLVIAGLGLEGPVHSTMRSANDRGFECLLLDDATSPSDIDVQAPSLSMVQMSGGIFGAVGSTQALLDALSSSKRPV